MACIDLRHLHILTSNPSLRGPLDNVPLGGQWVRNGCLGWLVQYSQSLPALHGASFLLASQPS